jgi:hypothetical protein
MKTPTKYIQAQQRLIELCAQNEEWLSQLIYHKGVAWLENRYKNVRPTINLLSNSKAFWSWWRNQMNLQIVEFIETIDLHPEMYHAGKAGYLTPELQQYILLQFSHFISTYRCVYPNEVVWKLAEKEMYAAVDVELQTKHHETVSK